MGTVISRHTVNLQGDWERLSIERDADGRIRFRDGSNESCWLDESKPVTMTSEDEWLIIPVFDEEGRDGYFTILGPTQFFFLADLVGLRVRCSDGIDYEIRKVSE
jgi:hypothetical protein